MTQAANDKSNEPRGKLTPEQKDWLDFVKWCGTTGRKVNVDSIAQWRGLRNVFIGGAS